jgi:hypothetical protein
MPARSWQEMRVEIEEKLVRDTGMGIAAWNAKVRAEAAPENQPDLRSWLIRQGVSGYAAMMLVYEAFGYPDYLEATADELLDGQYRDRENLRPIHDAVVAALPSIGDVELQNRKTYVALIGPKRTFASIQATTKSRVDIGLRLDGVAPAGRLEAAKSIGQSSMTHKIGLWSAADLDAEALGWIRRAYEANL